MENIAIKRIDNLDDAKNAWAVLSPQKNLSDNWDFRYCFYKYCNHPLHFYTGFDGEEIIGLLPLQFNKSTRLLEFFGGNPMKDNHVFLKPGYKDCAVQFYDAIERPATLLNITEDDKYVKSMSFRKDKYIADISEMSSIKDYFARCFKAKSRKNMRHAIEAVEKNKPEIIVNDLKDIDLMIELNINTFGERSSFNRSFRKEVFRDLAASDFEKYLFTFMISGKKGAVTFSIKYNDTYFFLNSGTNKEEFSDLGTYNIYKNFEKAIELKCKVLDAGLGIGNWKEKWHLEKVPQYLLIK